VLTSNKSPIEAFKAKLPVTLLYDNPTPVLKSVKEIPVPPVAVESAAGAHSVPDHFRT